MPSHAAIVTDPTLMNDLVRRLREGDSTGWEGDPRLTLAWNRPERRYELWRLERDSQYRLVARGPIDGGMPYDLTRQLVAHDQRRGFDVFAEVRAHNAEVERRQEADLTEKMAPAYEKLRWALRKDDRVGAGL